MTLLFATVDSGAIAGMAGHADMIVWRLLQIKSVSRTEELRHGCLELADFEVVPVSCEVELDHPGNGLL